MSQSESRQELTAKLNRETAKIPWSELQRFFASGNAVYTEESLDLIEVAIAFTEDNKNYINQKMTSGHINLVNDQQAGDWFNQNATVWAVVILPWVLVQKVK